jgi:hypothetical protein
MRKRALVSYSLLREGSWWIVRFQVDGKPAREVQVRTHYEALQEIRASSEELARVQL